MDSSARFIPEPAFSESSLREACNSLRINQLHLVETCLHAFELLGRLAESDLPFLFKGGTSLLLHTRELRRISTDIDIVSPVRGADLFAVLEGVSAEAPFVSFNEDERGFRGLPNRRHFRYYYRPVSGGLEPVPVLLDVVEDGFEMFESEERSIALPWFEPMREASARIQTARGLLGDKLAAFAPRTTGVPYLKPDGSEGDLLQIAKQFYDVAILFDHVENPSACLPAWREHVKKESRYRGRDFPESEILRDTFQACLAVTMVNFGKRAHTDSATIWRGIRNLSNHVAGGTLGHQQVFEMAGKIAWLTAALQSASPEHHTKPHPPEDPASLKSLKIDGEFRFLNAIRGASPLGLFYWSEAAKLAPVDWIKSETAS